MKKIRFNYFPWRKKLGNGFVLNRKYKNYSMFLKLDRSDEAIVNQIKEASIMTKIAMKHPILFEVRPYYKTILIANISHHKKRIEGIDVTYLGKRKDGTNAYLYGPYEMKLLKSKDWLNLIKLVERANDFDYEAELLPDTFDLLKNKCQFFDETFDVDIELAKMRDIEFHL